MVLLNVLIKPLWIFGIDRQVQVVVGAEVYGKYFSLLSLVFVFNIFLDLGITNYANRTIAADYSSLSSIVSNGIVAKLFLSLLYTVSLLIIAKSTGVQDNKLLLLLILLQVLTSFLLFFRGVVSAFQLFKTDSVLSVIDKGLMIVLAGIWLYTSLFNRKFDVYEFVWLQIITIIITLLISILILNRRKALFLSGFNRGAIKEIILQSIPFALTVFFMGLHNRTDAFLLERIHSNGAYEAGIYATAYRLLDAANMIGYLFASVLVSYWSKHVNDTNSIKKSLLFSHQLLIPSGILVALIAVFLNQPLFELLYHHKNDYAADILKWCLITIVPYFVIHIYATLLTATGKIKILMRLVIAASALNILLNIFLIPAYGAKACVFSGIVSQTTLALLAVFYVKTKTSQTVEWSVWLRYLFIAVILSFTGFFLQYYSLPLLPSLAIMSLVWIAAMNLLQIFSVKSFLSLINEK